MIKGYGEKISDLYNEIRNNNLKEEKKRREHIKKIHPKILDIETTIKQLYFKMIKSQNKSYLNSIHNLINYKNKLLLSVNLPINYLDSIYTCNDCKDTGYIITEKCKCYFRNLTNIYLKNSDLNILIQKNNFENFDFSYYSDTYKNDDSITSKENIQNIYSNILNYIKNFESININLLFKGECGSGKTFLSHCIAKELLSKGFSIIYKTSEDLFNELYEIYSLRNYNKIENSIIFKCDLLIIDDLGAENPKNPYYSYFFNFINKKLLLQKKLLISTNVPLNELQQNYSERIMSRILGNFKIYNFFVEHDIRLQKQIKG